MCELISKTFRAEHRDVEVIYKDGFGIEKKLYVGLALGPVDVNAAIHAHFAAEDALCEAVRQAVGVVK